MVKSHLQIWIFPYTGFDLQRGRQGQRGTIGVTEGLLIL